MQHHIKIFHILLLPLLLIILSSCLSTKQINLSEYNLFNNQRSLDVRELEASRILSFNINRIALREEDIPRLQELLQTNTLLVPLPQPVDNNKTINTNNLPSLGRIEQSQADINQAIERRTLSEREDYVRSLEIQAAIRLLSRDYSQRTFLLILEQLTSAHLHVQDEAFNYVMQADATYERYVWSILQSGRLDQEVRARIIPFFLKMGERGIVRLLILLQDYDPVIIDSVVQTLVQLYPEYTNPQLTLMVDSPYHRHWAPAWLFAYNQETPFNIGINLIDDSDPIVQNSTRQALLRNASPWILDAVAEAVEQPQTPLVRQLLIEYLVRYLHPSALYFVHELLIHEDSSVRSYANRYILNSESSYYPYLIDNLTNPQTIDPLLLALLPYTLRFIRLSTAEAILPLLDHPNPEICQATQIFFSQAYAQRNIQTLLLNTFKANLVASYSSIFIMQLFVTNHNPAILNSAQQNLDSQHLLFLFDHLPPPALRNFIDNVRPAATQVFLNRFQILYTQLQELNQFDLSNPLIQLAQELTSINMKLSENRQTQQQIFSDILQNQGNNSRLSPLQELRNQRDQLNNTLIAQAQSSPINIQRELTAYRQAIQNISTSLLSLRQDSRDAVNPLLARFNLNQAYIQAFLLTPII